MVIHMSTPGCTIAVFNASQDTIDMLTVFFGQCGYRAVGEPWPAREPLSFEAVCAFIAKHRPDVVVFDISFPYEHNWNRCKEFLEVHHTDKIPVVLTTTNERALTEMVGPNPTIEIIGKPYDLQRLAHAVARALSATVK